MNKCVIFLDQRDPKGRTIRYNYAESTRMVASRVRIALEGADMFEIPNEKEGEDPIFVNPERVASITPYKEKED